MKAIKYLLLCAAIFNCTCLQLLYAQSPGERFYTDSLLNEISKANHDTDKVSLYYKLVDALIPVNPDSAMYYADKYMNIAEKAGWRKGVGMAHMSKSLIYITTSDYINALKNAEDAFVIFDSLNWKFAMAFALVEMGNNYERLGYYSKAIEYNFKALSVYEDIKIEEPSVYNNLGVNYYWLSDYAKAIENYSKALEIHKKNNNKHGIASALDNIAIIYMEQGEYEKANQYNLQAIKLFEEINYGPELAKTYSIRGGLLQKQKDYNAAFTFFNKAIAINKELDIKSNLANDYASIGEVYYSLAKGDTAKSLPESVVLNKTSLIQNARFYFSESLNLAKETKDLHLMMQQAANLSETEELGGNTKTALALYKESANYKDSIFNDENKKKIAALENERLAEVKDKEIQILNKDKALQVSAIKRQTLIRNIVIGTVSVAAIITFFFIRSYNKRRKTSFDKQVLDTEMKALRAQMNPHFIFNSLHSINKYVLENDKDNASAYLSKFSKLMRLVLENSREQEVPLENDLQALELYMQLEALRFQNRFQYVIEVDENIDKENTLIPPLLLQPFAENSILHGLQNKDGGLIKIKISTAENNMMRCIVEDNGTGRVLPSENEPAQRTEKKRKSLGMKIMEERLYIINQLKKAKAAINIFDLKDANNNPGGVRVELLLPLQQAF